MASKGKPDIWDEMLKKCLIDEMLYGNSFKLVDSDGKVTRVPPEEVMYDRAHNIKPS